MSWSERLSKAINDKGWSQTELARRSGVSVESIHKYTQGGVDKPRGKTIDKLASALGVDSLWLEKGIEAAVTAIAMRPVEVIGHVQAGYWTEAFEWEEEDRYLVPVPADPEFAAYTLKAAEMRGPSMNKWRPEGTVVVFTDQIETHEDPRAGSRYFVQRTNGHEYECTIKKLWQDDAGEFWLLPESDDPRFQEPLALNGDSGEEIRIVGRVTYSVARES